MKKEKVRVRYAKSQDPFINKLNALIDEATRLRDSKLIIYAKVKEYLCKVFKNPSYDGAFKIKELSRLYSVARTISAKTDYSSLWKDLENVDRTFNKKGLSDGMKALMKKKRLRFPKKHHTVIDFQMRLFFREFQISDL